MKFKKKIKKLRRLFRSRLRLLLGKKTSVKRRRKATRKRKTTQLKAIQLMTPKEKAGYNDGKLLTEVWKLQTRPRKVHVGGYRIHHGLAGAGIAFIGESENDDYAKGFGESLMDDDIRDRSHWFDFDN